MIPEKINSIEKNNSHKDKYGSFALFDLENFLRKILKNWYWFVFMFLVGYVIAWVYSKYYTQNIYASNLSLSASSKGTEFLPTQSNQSINFIWGDTGSQDGLFLKKILLSRSHNEFLVKELDLFVNYSTKGLIKSTYLDKSDSPIFFQIDKKHFQQVNYPITLIPKENDAYEVVLPEEESTKLYDYEQECFHNIKSYNRPVNRVIRVNEWYNAPNLRFRLLKNPTPTKIKLDNIIINLKSVNESVNEIVSTTSVEFDKEIRSIMIITKTGYNLNSTVNFLNKSVAELQKKMLADKNLVDKNTDFFLRESLSNIRKKLDSSANVLNYLKTSEKLYNIKNRDEKSLERVKELEASKADIISKINSLNNIKNTLQSQRFDKMISIHAAGVEDGVFSAIISELKDLYAKKAEMATIYKPNSEPMREISRLIDEARMESSNSLREYYNKYYEEINKIDYEISSINLELASYPEKERRYLDAERGYNMIEATYNSLLARQNDAQMRMATNQSNITVIDPAKNLGQLPVGPNVKMIKFGIISGMLFLPLLFIFIAEIFDSKIRNIKELLGATKIPLLGIIGNNNNENMLTVLEQPKSSVSEAFRGIRANMRFLMDNEGDKGKVILVTSSIGGEGKTYVSINLASAIGLSDKKTILLGMDLRKPKIFGDFKIGNKYGISNYLTGEVGIDQIINKTNILNLDVITSGPIPPNPSELLMSQKNIRFIEEIKKTYDFIIIDSPPVGLVADSYELMKYSDANLYIVRHEYTEKYMLKMITEKFHNHEISNLGLIYNGYNTKQRYGYGYGYFDEDKNYKEPWLIRIKNKVRALFHKK